MDQEEKNKKSHRFTSSPFVSNTLNVGKHVQFLFKGIVRWWAGVENIKHQAWSYSERLSFTKEPRVHRELHRHSSLPLVQSCWSKQNLRITLRHKKPIFAVKRFVSFWLNGFRIFVFNTRERAVSCMSQSLNSHHVLTMQLDST